MNGLINAHVQRVSKRILLPRRPGRICGDLLAATVVSFNSHYGELLLQLR